MYSKVNYTIVGIFVLLFGVGLIWFAFWLAKYGIHREFDTYKLHMKESVSGLSKDSVVKLRGVDIGRVSEIRIDPKDIEKIDIFLKIKHGVHIKEDMIAHTEMLGVTGLLSIEIDGGTNQAKALEPTEDHIPIISTAPSWLSKTTRGLGSLTDRLSLLVDKGQKLLSENNIKTFGKVLNNIERLTAKGEEVEEKAIHSLEEIDMTLKEFRASMDKINKNFTEATTDFKEMQKDFASIKKVANPAIVKLMKTSDNFNHVTLKVGKSLDRGDYNLKKILEPVLVEIEVLSQQINDLAQQLEQSPNDLLFKARKPRRGPGE